MHKWEDVVSHPRVVRLMMEEGKVSLLMLTSDEPLWQDFTLEEGDTFEDALEFIHTEFLQKLPSMFAGMFSD